MSSATPDSQVSSAGLAASASGITPPSMPARQGVFLSDVIVELGFAGRETVEEAVRAAAASGKSFDRLLLENGVLDEEQLTTAVAERNGLDRVDLDRFNVDPVAATLIGRSAAMRYCALPIALARDDGALIVAVADPSDFLGVSDIEVMAKMEVRLVIASLNKIQALIENLPDDPPQTAIGQDGAETSRANGDVVEIGAPLAAEDDAGPTEIDQLRQELLDAAEERERLREEVDRLREELLAATGERERLREEVETAMKERESPPAETPHTETSVERVASEPSRAEAEVPDAIALGEVTLDEETGTATIPIRVESAGSLVLSGKGVQSSSAIVAAADSTNLDVIPTEKKRRKLDETGRAKVEVNVTFVPTGGEPRTQVTEVKLVKREPPPRDLRSDPPAEMDLP